MFFFSYFNEVLGVQMEFINAQMYFFTFLKSFCLTQLEGF